MCGIAGICRLGGGANPDAEIICRMVSSLSHRGPDETGVYLDDWASLGHARLSIIDLSEGTQPIHNEDRSLWIVYNGEVYNYLELREDLLALGHCFYTDSDTEVLLHLYEEMGEACLEKLNGQFAFAIWNKHKRELFMARDRCGIRPLHYCLVDQTFLFASEIKSLFTHHAVERRLDPVALDQVFTFWTTLPGRTAFAGIHELPAGHCLSLAQGQLKVRSYWQIPLPHQDHLLQESPAILTERVETLLTDAIRLRLRADVPVGSYLSGGLDSSGVTAMVAKRFNHAVKTFGIRFTQSEYDEGTFQNDMADYLGCQHREVLVHNADVGDVFTDVVWHCEKPLLRTAPAPLLLLSRFVRQDGLKVVLSGEGADEIFGGYNIFREAKVRRFWSRFSDSRIRPALLSRLYPYIFDDARLKSSMTSFFAQGLDHPEDPLFSHMLRWGNTGRLKRFFSQALLTEIGDYDACAELRAQLPVGFDRMHWLSQAQHLEMTIFLSNYLLSSQGDRMAMANSVELRLPYLDYRVIELMSRVPAKWKILGLHEKHLLKRVFRPMLPPAIVARSKHPYRAPIHQSLLDEGHEETMACLCREVIDNTGLFDGRKVELLVRKLQRISVPSEMDGMALAGIVSTQHLVRRFIDQWVVRSEPVHTPDKLFDMRSSKHSLP